MPKSVFPPGIGDGNTWQTVCAARHGYSPVCIHAGRCADHIKNVVLSHTRAHLKRLGISSTRYYRVSPADCAASRTAGPCHQLCFDDAERWHKCAQVVGSAANPTAACCGRESHTLTSAGPHPGAKSGPAL